MAASDGLVVCTPRLSPVERTASTCPPAGIAAGGGLRRYPGESASALSVSAPARCSLSLRPAWSLSRARRPLAPERFSRSRYRLRPPARRGTRRRSRRSGRAPREGRHSRAVPGGDDPPRRHRGFAGGGPWRGAHGVAPDGQRQPGRLPAPARGGGRARRAGPQAFGRRAAPRTPCAGERSDAGPAPDRPHLPPAFPCCHPGLVPGSRPAPDFDPGKAGRGRCSDPGSDSGGAERDSPPEPVSSPG